MGLACSRDELQFTILEGAMGCDQIKETLRLLQRRTPGLLI
jgi:hypothetical protein